MRWLFATLGLALALPCWGAATCSANSGAARTPLVELYTAEGCNMCPPADRWLGTLVEGTPDVAALAFHVTYWNDDGWVDPFSDAAFTERQSYREHLAHKKTLVTPQVMVGTNLTVDWRESGAVNRALRTARQGKPELTLSLSGAVAGDRADLQISAVPVDGKATATPAMLWLALYQKGADSKISAGENRGVSLHHTNIVRKLAGPWKVEAKGTHGSVAIPLHGMDPSGLGVVLFAERAEDAQTLQSVVLPFAGCK